MKSRFMLFIACLTIASAAFVQSANAQDAFKAAAAVEAPAIPQSDSAADYLNYLNQNEKALDEAETEIKRIDDMLSTGNENSEISRLNKSKKEAVIYSFTLDGQPDQANTINLAKDPALPPDFDCFFGYGFEMPAVPELI